MLALILGALMFVISTFSIIKNYKFSSTAIKTNGKIVDVEMSESDNIDDDGRRTASKSYRPVIEFSASNGTLYKFTSSYGSGSKNKYKIGQEIKIMYNSDKPEKAKIDSLFVLYGIQIVFVIAGIAFFVFGIQSL